MSMPSADEGPDNVLTKPTLTLSAAKAEALSSAATVTAMVFLCSVSITSFTLSKLLIPSSACGGGLGWERLVHLRYPPPPPSPASGGGSVHVDAYTQICSTYSNGACPLKRSTRCNLIFNAP